MHELSLAEAIAATAAKHAGDRSVAAVVVRVGHLRQVVPDALSFCWTLLTQDTALDGCTLEIEQVPAVIHCAGCGQDTTLDVPLLICPGCEGHDVTLRSGEEFHVVSLDLAEV